MAVHRIEVWDRETGAGTAAGGDLGVLKEALHGLGAPVNSVQGSRLYLVEADIDQNTAQAVAQALLADPVDQHAVLGVRQTTTGQISLEVHDLPGVMDPAAETARAAIAERLGVNLKDVRVRTGRRLDLAFEGETPEHELLLRAAQRSIANPVVEHVHLGHEQPETLALGRPYQFELRHIPLDGLNADQLKTLSREQHLFLSVEEMKTIQAHFAALDRDPTDIELETLAQTWSEHCVHKTLKSSVRYTGFGIEWMKNLPGVTADGESIVIPNLLKHTVAAATFELMEQTELGDWCVSVFHDNSGVVRFDDEDGVCIKVETHNHPSALEPYGGAATGIGGCIRDIIGTGLAARPIANTDVFCVALPDTTQLPAGVIHPKQTLRRVVEGVRDYGNRMGIPTVNGAVAFDPDYIGNPLVFAGCVGLIPLDRVDGNPQPGDRIIAVGGATGRDGIHGATFSSAELTDAHAEEFSHAVQIGNPITQKKLLDAIMAARDWTDPATGKTRCLYRAITDCGAGGFSSAIGEMGEKVGAQVDLDRAPLKYDGLSYTEIWISEAQERMVLAVPEEDVQAFAALCDAEGAQWCDLGTFGVGTPDNPELVLRYDGTEVARMAMGFLHDGVPKTQRVATAQPKPHAQPNTTVSTDWTPDTVLKALLAHPTIASKHWIIRQYDHEVQGGSVVKPLTGVEAQGPSDASVVRPKLSSNKAIALGNGLAPQLSEKSVQRATSTDGDAYHAVLAAIDEAIRNVVCVGADPQRVAILDNFCWPSCDDPESMASLARAAAACYHGAKAYRTPFVSGKDSLHNQFTTEDGRLITIPSTMLISAMGMIDDASHCITSDAKAPDDALIIVGPKCDLIGASHLAERCKLQGPVPRVDLEIGPRTAKAVAGVIRNGKVRAAHDVSDGGIAVAAFEMALGGKLGVHLNVDALSDDPYKALFGEGPSRYLLSVAAHDADTVIGMLKDAGAEALRIGTFHQNNDFTVDNHIQASMTELRHAWLGTLDW